MARQLQSSAHSIDHDLSPALSPRAAASSSSTSPIPHDVNIWEQSPPGHIGIMRALRRSIPSPCRLSWSAAGYQDASVDRGICVAADLVSEQGWNPPVDPLLQVRIERRAQQPIHTRRIRRPADYGANLGHNSRHRGNSWCADSRPRAAPEDVTTAALQETKSQVRRCSSLPPTGSGTAEDVPSAMEKANAVAMLQKLFFEEMSKGGQDPSGAAARALLRLNEVPQEGVVTNEAFGCSSGPVENVIACDSSSRTSSPVHRPMVPQVPPPPGANGRRRPRPATLLPVRS